MTSPTQGPQVDQDLDSAVSLPYLASKTLERRSLHFSESLWKLSKTSLVMSLLDALCNDSGAGDLKKQLLISRLQNSLDSTHFSDLDLIFSNLLGFPRYLSESYSYSPTTQMLTSDQWDEVVTKDARYRSRIRDFMAALHLGGTPYGFRMMCKAVLEVDCDLFEVWKYLDSPNYQTGLHLEDGGSASSPNQASFQITGDLGIIVTLRPIDLTPSSTQTLFSLWDETGDQRGYRLSLTTGGNLELQWSTNGAVGTVVTKTSTVSLSTVSSDTKQIAVGVTIDVDNGAAGNDVDFYYDLGDFTFPQLGATVTTGGVTSIHPSTADLIVGNTEDPGTTGFVGIIYDASLYSDLIFTAIEAFPNFTEHPSGTTSFTDAASVPWTINDPGRMVPNYQLGRSGSDLRTEVVVKPQRVITQQEKRLLVRALDRLKPREVVVTVAEGVEASTQSGVTRVSSDSEYYEVNLEITGALDVASLPPPDTLSDIRNWYLEAGASVDSRSSSFSKSQEYSQVYTFSEGDIGAIDFVVYESAIDPDGVRTTEGTHLSQSTPTDIFSPWGVFGLADSPDNFPGGKYGQTPTRAPALNQDGTTYVFRYASQAAFIAEQQALVIARGGEVSGSRYRTRLTSTSSLSAKAWDPLDALFREVDLRTSSVTSSPYSSRRITTVGV